MTEVQAERYRSVLRSVLMTRFDGNQTRLGEAIGLSQSGVSQQLSGKNGPALETLLRLSELAGMSVAEVLTGDPVTPRGFMGEAQHRRADWQSLITPAIETLVREGFSLDEAQRGVNAVQAIRSGKEITLESLVSIARDFLRIDQRGSGKHRRHT